MRARWQQTRDNMRKPSSNIPRQFDSIMTRPRPGSTLPASCRDGRAGIGFSSVSSTPSIPSRVRPSDRYDAAELLLKTNRDLPEAAHQMRTYIQGGGTVEGAPVFRAHFLLGEILLKSGDTGRAAAEYREAITLASSYRPASEALRRLEAKPQP